MDNNIWFSNINLLFSKDNLFKIVPSSNMTIGEKINTITRFALYLSILLYLTSGNYLYFYIILVTVVSSYLLYIFKGSEFFHGGNEGDNDGNEFVNVDNDVDNISITSANATTSANSLKDCTKPTNDNPLMNPLIGDNPNKNKEACNITNNTILENIDKKFCDRLYQNTSNIFSNRNNQQRFYSMPNTRIPNDQTAFANWLYKTPIVCLTGDSMLLKQHSSCSFNSKTLSEINKE
jgi:hypothetical protein